tara:strand:- start:258 stop:377 length:120 start_codon:yes stop_codon:yes gene_type:complete
MKYEDLPEDLKPDVVQMVQDIVNGVRTYDEVAQEILSRI